MAELRRQTTGEDMTISFSPGSFPVLGYEGKENTPVKKNINDLAEALKNQLSSITNIEVKDNQIIADVKGYNKPISDKIREIVKSFIVPEELNRDEINPYTGKPYSIAYDRQKNEFSRFKINFQRTKDVKSPATKEMSGELAWFAFPIMEKNTEVIRYIVNKIQDVANPSKPEFNPLIPIYKAEYGTANMVYVLAKREESVYDYISSIGKMYFPIGLNTLNQMTPLKTVSEIAKAVGMHEANSFIIRKFLTKNPNFFSDLLEGKIGPEISASFYDTIFEGLKKNNPNFVILIIDAIITPKTFKSNRPVFFKEERFVEKHKKFVGNKRGSETKEAVTKYRSEKGDILSNPEDIKFSLVIHTVTEFARSTDINSFQKQGIFNQLEDRMILNDQTENLGDISLSDKTLDENILSEMFSSFDMTVQEIKSFDPETLLDPTILQFQKKINPETKEEEIIQGELEKEKFEFLREIDFTKMSSNQDIIKIGIDTESTKKQINIDAIDKRIKEINFKLKEINKNNYEKEKRLESLKKINEADYSNLYSSFKFDQTPRLNDPSILEDFNAYLLLIGKKGTYFQYLSGGELESEKESIEPIIKEYAINKLNESKRSIDSNLNNLILETSIEVEKLEDEKNLLSNKLYNQTTIEQIEDKEQITSGYIIETGIYLNPNGVFEGQYIIYKDINGTKGEIIKRFKFNIGNYTIDNIINEYGKAEILDAIVKSIQKYSNVITPIMNPDRIGNYITFPIDVKLGNINDLTTHEKVVTKQGRIRFIQQGDIAMDKLEQILTQTEESMGSK
jgi:hypothetical protein